MRSETRTSPANLDIVQRHMGFEFPKNLTRYWAAGDPYETHLFNALSLTFPKGEQMFVDSVRAFRDRITDPALAEDVRAFVGQEMQHSKEHEAFNRWIESLGLPTDSIYAFIDARQAEARLLPPEALLAVTCALEHFTAIMADAILSDETLVEEIDPAVRALWVWHAIEETEHKAVAFDVFRSVVGSEKLRRTTMLYVTVDFLSNVTRFHLRLLRADGQLTNVPMIARSWWKYWGPRGRFTKLIPAYLDYFREDFHPWQHDNRDRVAKWKSWIDGQAKRLVPQSRAREDRKAA